MHSTNQDDASLLIRCPSCGQRFRVGDDLRGRTVECGGCEHRFRINDDVIVRGKKFYPGERKDPKLNRFQRVPLAMAPEVTGISTIRYAEPPDPKEFEPVAPQRVIAGVIGVTGMVFIGLLLMFGAKLGGILDGIPTPNRLLMAGFAGLLGTVLLIYANPRGRGKAMLMGLGLSGVLAAVPFFFTVGSVPLGPTVVVGNHEPKAEPKHVEAAPDKNAELRSLIGTGPLVAEIERLTLEGSTKQAVGLWLRGLREQHRFLVRDYILRTTGADPPLVFYPRGTGDFLLVVTGINLSLDEVAQVASHLGSLEKTYPDISVVEVRVNNESFVTGAIDKLTDKASPAFYDLNKKELDSIDLERVQRAVQRLAEAEPKIYRSDITTKLIGLLGAKGVDFKADICNALATWSEKPGPAGNAALMEVKGMLARKEQIPPEMIALIVKEKNTEVVPILDELWAGGPTHWEALYSELGPLVEAPLLRRFADTDGMLRQSAVRLLGQVGGADSLPVLEACVGVSDPELKVLLGKSIASIRSRIDR
jgi:predicted Zn finger-like uncharacterized protein